MLAIDSPTLVDQLEQGGVVWHTRDGEAFKVRYMSAEDAPLLVELYDRSSAETLRLRFFTDTTHMPRERILHEATHLADVDPARGAAIVATNEEAGVERIIASARLMYTDPQAAEFAIMVRDDYQGRGVGSFLFPLLVRLSIDRGLRQLTAIVQAGNTAMCKLIKSLGLPFDMTVSHGEINVVIDLDPGWQPAFGKDR